MKNLKNLISYPFLLIIIIITFIILNRILNYYLIILFVIYCILIIMISFIFLILKRHDYLIICIITLILFMVLFIRLNNIESGYTKLKKYFDRDITFLGYVDEFSLNRGKRIDFIFKVTAVKTADDFLRIDSFNILVKCKIKEGILIKKGDALLIKGIIKLPPNAINNFNYRDYLFYQGIYGIIETKTPFIQYINSNIDMPFHLILLKNSIWLFKDRVIGKLKKDLDSNVFALLLSIFFGIRSDIDQTINLEFQNTGMTHLLAISGMNITFIGGIFILLARYLMSKSRSYLISMIIILLYISMLYYSASSIRAFIMYAIYGIFFICGFRISGFSILSFSAIIMTLINPYCLFDLGFQLSFLATAGILLFSGYFKEKLPLFLHEKIKSLISVTLSAFFSIILLQWVIFKKIQIFALLSSIIIIPLFEFLFIYLFFVISIYYLFDFHIFIYLIEIPVKIFLKIIHFLNFIPPVNLPEIPEFIAYLSIPILFLLINLIFPYFSKLIQKTKKTSLFIDIEKKIT
jgi:competence protein ComEC